MNGKWKSEGYEFGFIQIAILAGMTAGDNPQFCQREVRPSDLMLVVHSLTVIVRYLRTANMLSCKDSCADSAVPVQNE